MGAVHVTVTLKNLASAKRGQRSQKGAQRKRRWTYTADFLIDTGATDSLAPAAELRKIGVRSAGTMDYELADGTIQQYAFGLLEIAFMGERTAGRVIFGPDNAEPLLGVTALESVGVMVDPVNQTLKRLPALRLK